MSAYERSSLLKYLEEGMAEGYAQLRVNGLAAAFKQYRFPIGDGVTGYVTASELVGEGVAIGAISFGGAMFFVYIVRGPARR
jgi:hypothetical protein